LDDIDYTFAALQREFIRHYFWHMPFGEKALRYALKLGKTELEARVPRQLRTRIGKASNPYDGRQTPIKPERTNAIDISTHAVAACCRTCVEGWHGIPKGRALTDEEIEYLSELARRFLRARLPDLDNRPLREIRQAARSDPTA
jgi:hypothetical protein